MLLNSGDFDITHDGKHLILFPGKMDDSMVYFAPLDEQLYTGGRSSQLEIIPIIDRMDSVYNVSHYDKAPIRTRFLHENVPHISDASNF